MTAATHDDAPLAAEGDWATGHDLGRPLRSRRAEFLDARRPRARRIPAWAGAVAIRAAAGAIGLPATGLVGGGAGPDAAADAQAMRAAADTLRQGLPRPEAVPERRVKTAALGEAPLGMTSFTMPEDIGGGAAPSPAVPSIPVPGAAPSAASLVPAAVGAPPAAAPSVPEATPSVTVSSNEVNAFLARARSAIETGDVAGARRLMERAAAGGSALALYSLAETFDPARLAEWKVRGIRADPAKARQLYERARAGGYAPAEARLAALR